MRGSTYGDQWINWIISIFLLMVVGCQSYQHITDYTAYQVDADVQGRLVDRRFQRDRWEAFVPDTNHLDYSTARTIYLNVHYIFPPWDKDKYSTYAALNDADSLIVYMNRKLQHNPKMIYAPLVDQPNYPFLWKFERAYDDNGNWVHFHYDSTDCYMISHGRDRNNHSKAVIEKYGIGNDTIVGVFILLIQPDSVASTTYKATFNGISLGTDIKLAGWWENLYQYDSRASTTNHEFGHMVGLSHPFQGDNCEDTPKMVNNPCWMIDGTPKCDTLAHNNMMDYNAYQTALSPCQIGTAQMNMANLKHRSRAVQKHDWCYYKKHSPIIINDSISWAADKDFNTDIFIKDGAVLRINGRVHLPQGAGIYIAPYGKLILGDYALLHNDCGAKWKGVFNKNKEGSNIQISTQAKIQDVEMPEDPPPVLPDTSGQRE